YTQGDSATISETVSLIDPTMCTNNAVVTNVNGTPTNNNLGAGFPVTLSQVSNTVTVTNTVNCESRLTLVKQVQGGSAAPTAWTLTHRSSPTRRSPPR